MTDEEIKIYANSIREQFFLIAEHRGIDKSDPTAMQGLFEQILSETGHTCVDGVWKFAQN